MCNYHKKKLRQQLKTHFPKLFPDTDELTLYSNIKRKLILLLSPCDDEDERDTKVYKIDQEISDMDKPGIFTQDSSLNSVVQLENSYNELCAAIESNGSSTDGLTVMQLYGRLNYYKMVNEKLTQNK